MNAKKCDITGELFEMDYHDAQTLFLIKAKRRPKNALELGPKVYGALEKLIDPQYWTIADPIDVPSDPEETSKPEVMNMEFTLSNVKKYIRNKPGKTAREIAEAFQTKIGNIYPMVNKLKGIIKVKEKMIQTPTGARRITHTYAIDESSYKKKLKEESEYVQSTHDVDVKEHDKDVCLACGNKTPIDELQEDICVQCRQNGRQ